MQMRKREIAIMTLPSDFSLGHVVFRSSVRLESSVSAIRIERVATLKS